MKKYILSLCTFSLLVTSWAFAQEVLKPVAGQNIVGDLLGENKLTKVSMIAQGERKLTVSVAYNKLPAGKDFSIKGTILNRVKRPLPDIPVVSEAVSSSQGSVDLSFAFSPSRSYSKTYIESLYILISVVPEDENAELLNGIFDNVTVSGEDYMYHLKKKWRVGGSEEMIIKVKLVPFKTARYVKR